MMFEVRRGLLPVFAVWIALACERVPDSAVDLAAARVIRHAEFPPLAARPWSVDSLAAVSIGVAEGAPEYQFSRIAGIAPHRGGYLVADGASSELRYFDGEGRYAQSVGGPGEGPGEFTQLRWLGTIQGDTVLAWDLRFRRITVYDGDLQLIDTRPLAMNDIYIVLGAFGDGTLLLWPFAGSPLRQVASAEVVEATSYFALVPYSDGAVLDTVLALPAQPRYVTPEETVIGIPFMTNPSVAAGRSDLWGGNGTTGSLARYDKRGEKLFEIFLPRGGQITQEDIEAYVARDLERYEGAERASRARLYRDIPTPEEFPSYDRLLVDGRDNVWVRSYRRITDVDQRWVVFDRDGEPIGNLKLPLQFELRVIPDERVLGIWRDDLGVESVRVYRIERE